MSIANKCPICLNDRKVLIKCTDCGKKHCNECSINNVCIDCFVSHNENIILQDYTVKKVKT